jgi:3-phosphoglycerate kinase
MALPPSPPVRRVLGGAKVSDKIDVVRSPSKVDRLSSAAAWPTPSFARRVPTGKSSRREDKVGSRTSFPEGGAKLGLPGDHVVASRFEATADSHLPIGEIPDG